MGKPKQSAAPTTELSPSSAIQIIPQLGQFCYPDNQRPGYYPEQPVLQLAIGTEARTRPNPRTTRPTLKPGQPQEPGEATQLGQIPDEEGPEEA
ncbi:hypothetical protein LX36DRAFT_664253 [Colletotrichum falcatum]|nr:hypothetical protein LX36DRAFT_664253 [Colletotrichum falcatum]